MILIKTNPDDDAVFQQLLAEAIERADFPKWASEHLARNRHEVVGAILTGHPIELVELFYEQKIGQNRCIHSINGESSALGDFGNRIVDGKDTLYEMIERCLATGER